MSAATLYRRGISVRPASVGVVITTTHYPSPAPNFWSLKEGVRLPSGAVQAIGVALIQIVCPPSANPLVNENRLLVGMNFRIGARHLLDKMIELLDLDRSMAIP
jgi:hypothetical protein